ncbi:MAG: MMPL family transporter, partial [Alphaproteobacteria bacterium]
ILANAWCGESGPDRSHGVWLSRDGKEALLLVRTRAAPFDLNGQAAAVDALKTGFESVRGSPGMRLRMSGPSIFAVDIRARIKNEMFVLSTLSSVAVVVLLLLVFRSFGHLVALGVPLLGGLIAGAAAVQLVYGHIHGLTLTFGSTLVGLAIDYPIYLAMHAAGRAAPREAARQIQTPLLISVLTAMAGFFPLTVSSFPGLSQLGLICMVGLFVAAILTRIVLPSLLATRPPSRGQAALAGTVAILPALRRLQVPSVILVAAALVYFVASPRSPWQDDLARLSPLAPEMLQIDRQLRAEMQAADARSLIVVRGASADQVLERLETLTPDLDRATAAKQIESYDAPTRYLPSARSQQARKAALPAAESLKASLNAALRDMPFKPDTFAPFLRDVEAARVAPPVTPADFAGTQLALRIGALLFEADGGWIGMVLLNGTQDAAPLAASVRAHADPNIVFLDLKRESDALVASYRNEALQWLIAGAVLAIVVLAIGLRNWRDVLRVAGPITMAALLTGAILHLLGEPLSIFNLMALLIVEGVGMDYRVFFARPFADAAERAQTFASILLCAASTFVVFAVLAFSALPVLHSIGLTVAIGTALSLLLTCVFAKPFAPRAA